MAIPGFDDVRLKEVLAANLTPSDFIKTKDRLFGREKSLQLIDRALSSPGRQVFIHGDRGVGKTSVALTAAYIRSRHEPPIHVNCGSSTGFAAIMQAIGNAVIPVKDRVGRSGSRGSVGVNILGVGANITPRSGPQGVQPPATINEALDIIRYIESKTEGSALTVVVDEMERIQNTADRELFAEFIKNVSTATKLTRFIFCGIGSNVTELLGAHPSVGRVLETVELKRIHHDHLWKIITTPAEALGITVDQDKLIRIGQISDGFPHYVHLVGESLFWTMFDDANLVTRAGVDHFRGAIRQALERTETVLRIQYDQATKKTKNTEDYEEALWALADKTSDRRQLTDIYDSSYCRIMLKRTGRPRLPKEKLNQRLLSLRKESHGRIVSGFGSGWFGFRENIMRGYVRLDAENKGVELGREAVGA